MFAFWAAAGILSAAVAGLILFRAARTAQADLGDATPSVYRRQLAEIDDLADRGLIAEDERRSAQAEAARRLFVAADQPQEAWSRTGGRRAVLITAVATPLAALALYLAVGSPGTPDQPYAARLDGWRNATLTTLSAAEMAAVLRQAVNTHPNDPEGYRYLGLAEGSAEDGPAAVRAFRHAIALAPQRADLWSFLGIALVYEAGGQVTPQAVAAFQHTLALDPKDAVARFHLGQARIAAGDRVGGVAAWRALIQDLPEGDPRRLQVQAAIDEAMQAPGQLGGDQLTAIRGMVEGLAQRLHAQPDDAAGWVRLVRAYAVLGDAVRRDAALAEARTRYAARPDVVADLLAAAKAPPMAAGGAAR